MQIVSPEFSFITLETLKWSLYLGRLRKVSSWLCMDLLHLHFFLCFNTSNWALTHSSAQFADTSFDDVRVRNRLGKTRVVEMITQAWEFAKCMKQKEHQSWSVFTKSQHSLCSHLHTFCSPGRVKVSSTRGQWVAVALSTSKANNHTNLGCKFVLLERHEEMIQIGANSACFSPRVVMVVVCFSADVTSLHVILSSGL